MPDVTIVDWSAVDWSAVTRCTNCNRLHARGMCLRGKRLEGHARPKSERVNRPGRRLAVFRDAELYPEHYDRPRTRGDCYGGPRPCPWVGCKYNLYLDVTLTGSVKLNFPDLEPHEMSPAGSCSLDVADGGGETLEVVGKLLNVVRERVRQIEDRALAKLDHVRELREVSK